MLKIKWDGSKIKILLHILYNFTVIFKKAFNNCWYEYWDSFLVRLVILHK